MAHQVICRDAGNDCDFMVRSENQDELIEMVKMHAKETHDLDYSTDDVKGVMKSA
jgi:predicted small metal-binding protein